MLNEAFIQFFFICLTIFCVTYFFYFGYKRACKILNKENKPVSLVTKIFHGFMFALLGYFVARLSMAPIQLILVALGIAPPPKGDGVLLAVGSFIGFVLIGLPILLTWLLTIGGRRAGIVAKDGTEVVTFKKYILINVLTVYLLNLSFIAFFVTKTPDVGPIPFLLAYAVIGYVLYILALSLSWVIYKINFTISQFITVIKFTSLILLYWLAVCYILV